MKLSFAATPEPHALHANLERIMAKKLLLQGVSGSGKSYTARTLIEGTHGRVQQIIVDPEGEFHTLREKFDDYLIVGSSDSDIPLTPKTCAATCHAILKANLNLVLDLSEHDADEFCQPLFQHLGELPKREWRHLLMVIDEAQKFAPQDANAASKTALKNLAKTGRKRGFGLVCVTTRIASLDKNVAYELNSVLIGQTSGENDIASAARKLGYNKQEARQLPLLETGEFIAFGPAFSKVAVRVTSATPVTTHPTIGQIIPPSKPSAKLNILIEQFRTVASDDPRGEVAVNAEVLAELAETKRALRASEQELARLKEAMQQAASLLTLPLGEQANALSHEATNAHSPPAPMAVEASASPGVPATPHLGKLPSQVSGNGITSLRNTTLAKSDPRRILNTLRQGESMGMKALDRKNLAVLAGVSPKSSSYLNLIAHLANDGSITYPQPGLVALTSKGRTLAAEPTQVLTLEALHAQWLFNLGGYEASLLTIVLQTYPRPLSREVLAERAGYSPNSSSYLKSVANLKSFGLIDYPSKGTVVATTLLFPEQLSRTKNH
jgi:uncharacterized protein